MKNSPDIEFTSQRLIYKNLDASFHKPCLEYYSQNKTHFSKALPAPAPNFYTEKYFMDMLWNEWQLFADGIGLRLYLFDIKDLRYKKIIGDVSLMQILRGASQSCKMGYKISADYARRGLMREAVSKVTEFAFAGLGLHRIEINIMPDNTPSIKLAENIGFKNEGIAYKYLKIGGNWEDHIRYSLISSEN